MKTLIHQGIPIVPGGSTLGGPAGGFTGSVAGHELANIVGRKETPAAKQL